MQKVYISLYQDRKRLKVKMTLGGMGGPTVVPGYSRAYPAQGGIHMYSIIVYRGIYMYSIVKVSKLRFFTIFSL